MSKVSPFDYVKGINNKVYTYDLSGYVPFLTNRAFAMHLDTCLLAEEMNQYHQLSPQLQYDFYFHAVRRGSRYGFPPKLQDPPHIDTVMSYFGYSRQKALEALRLLTPTDIAEMVQTMDKGGNK